MGPINKETPIYNKKLSTVVPARATEENKVHEFTNMDLAMKLHYLRGVYFFKSEVAQGLDIHDLKKPMFQLLDLNFPTAGRIRLSENGRPFIRCNDSGVRILEAESNKTLDEWLNIAMSDHSLNGHLTYNHVLGPDLGFSPLVFIQFTWFKCGGISVGLSWAHILGDAFSASAFINMWAQLLANHLPPQPLKSPNPNTGKSQIPSVLPGKPFSLKRVDPVGDHWVSTNNCKMETHSFHLTAKQINHLFFYISGLNQTVNFQPFELLSAILWKSLAKVRGKSEPGIVTICTNNTQDLGNEFPGNKQVISTVKVDSIDGNADILALVKMISEKKVDERNMIEEFMERSEIGNSDFIVYGANLTFVNLEGAETYELELKGLKPVYANYVIDGVGEEGVVLVLPGPPDNGKKGGGGGRTVTIILPENQLVELKNELKKEWGIV